MHSIRYLLLFSFAIAFVVACDGGDTESPAPSPDAGVGDECGGEAGLVCDDGLWCDFSANGCGGDDSLGECRARPDQCPDVVDPVCGCDGTVYDNACEAQVAGADVSAAGGCEPPAEQFACGERFCSQTTEYCQVIASDIGGDPSEFRCLSLPGSCGDAPDCDCLASEPCAGFDLCEDDAGNLTLICPGG